MGAEKVATAFVLGALTGLFLWVGLPALLPPQPVPGIELVEPVADTVEGNPDDEGQRTPETGPDDDDSGDSGDDGGGGDDGADEDDDDSGSDDDEGDDD
jgi:hypothetical protein